MDQRDEYLPGVPCWVNHDSPDPAAAEAFYSALLGWRVRDGVATLEGSDVAGIGPQQTPATTATWTTVVAVESADDTVARATAGGGSALAAPVDVPNAGRLARLADPAGAAFAVWEAHGQAGAQLVNVPGSWNWSGLNTADVAAAEAFYGPLFHWEVDPSGLVRRPGYGEFLERSDPGLRERHAAAGAPEGFSDAVAWMIPSTDGDPRWTVTFSVADADAVAERAAELGGEVVTPPTDSEWVRDTTLRDPQGALFTASKFVPPS